MARTVLHLSPHPDDEIAGAPATLMALRDAGWRVVNVACGLGRPAQHQRRRAEVEEACRRAGFELLVCDPPLPLSAGDDLAGAEDSSSSCSGSSSPTSLRHSCVLVAARRAPRPRARWTRGAARARGTSGRRGAALALGRLGRSPVPDADRAVRPRAASQIQHALAAHASELQRLPLDRLLEARASSTPAWARSGCTARASPATRRSSSPSCCAR